MTICTLGAGAASIPFVLLGLWPVAGFMALNVVALCVAFRLSYRAGRSLEQVVLTPVELLIRRVGHRGDKHEWRFNPLWTKLAREDDSEFGMQRLALVSRGGELVIARELSPSERASFAEALGNALAGVKRGF